MTVINTLEGSLEITITPADSLAMGSNLTPHGEAVAVNASLNGSPLASGSPLPVSLQLTLSYTDPLPEAVPDEELLAVYYSSQGNDWSRYPCPAGSCQQDEAANHFTFTLDSTGYYALAAPILDRLTVEPSSVSLAAGYSQQFQAHAFDLEGSEISDAPVHWDADPAAGNIDQNGLFTATGSPGIYPHAVIASLGSLFAQAQVEIEKYTAFLPINLMEIGSSLTPNDPYFRWQWNMEQIQAAAAWPKTIGDGPIVAVLDSGVNLTHPDLEANLIGGWDFVNNDGSPEDDNGHGTHVAGIVAAVGDNGIGVAGVQWRGRVMPLKVLDSAGVGEASVAGEAMHWAVDHGARIINLSLGSVQSSLYLEEAVNYAISKGVLVVAAVGNVDPSRGIQLGNPVYPAAYPGVLGVGATDSTASIYSKSNQGFFVDMVAPGSGVLSTYLSGGYTYYSGTSMATPHASGVAALIWSLYPHLTAPEVSTAMMRTAQDLGTQGWDAVYGYGIVDAATAVAKADSVVVLGTLTDSFTVTEAVPEPLPGTYRPGIVLATVVDADAYSFQNELHDFSIVAQALKTDIPGLIELSVPQGQEAAIAQELLNLPSVQRVSLDYLVFAM